MRVHIGVYIYHMCIIDPVYAYVYICVYIHMYLYTHIYVYVNVYIYMHVYVVFWRATSSNQSTIVSRAAGLGGEASGQHQQSQTSLGISDILRHP